ncbi:MAG TPA: SEC-C domain-containing protein [Euzebya sp.]|nr:SEC-C domain-containing protein [Euzebya sp.]
MSALLTALLGSEEEGAAFLHADEDGRFDLVAERHPTLPTAAIAIRTVVLNQIADGIDPVAVATAERLLDEGVAPPSILTQMSVALTQTMVDAVSGPDSAVDVSAYHAALARLPLPSPFEMEDTLVEVAYAEVVIDREELLELVLERLGADPDDAVVRGLLGPPLDSLLGMAYGPVVDLEGDTIVSTEAIAVGMILTHTLTEEEVAGDRLRLDLDLATFAAAAPEPFSGGEELEPVVDDDDVMWWEGPEGWLADLGAGTTIAVSLDEDLQQVAITPLDAAPAVDRALAEAVRRVYDEQVGAPAMPVPGSVLLAGLRADDPGVLTDVTAPLTDLCAAAGLEVRGRWVAHDATVWREGRWAEHAGLIARRTEDDDELQGVAMAVLITVSQLVAGRPVEPERVDQVLDALTDLDVLGVVDHALTDPVVEGEDPTPPEVLLPHARKGAHRAAVRFLAAVLAERGGDVLAAEQHLELAYEARPTFAPSTDRLAWYASDKGDAARAARLWRRLPGKGDNPDLAEVKQALSAPAATPSGPTPARNDPCWCGSGRKFKRCHLGLAQQATLPDRVGWLCRKAVAYLERSGLVADRAVVEVVSARVGDDPDRWEGALADPLVMDLVLTEGGWFARFLQDRGPLLPDDEALLAASWLTVDRTVYEVEGTRPGEGLTLRDLRSGEVVAVRERTFSQVARPGDLVCGRAVPDGETAQLVGAVVPVRPGQESDLLEVLDLGNPAAVAAWVGAAERPPRMATREGEDLVAVEVVVVPADAAAMRRHLDDCYEAVEPGEVWVEHHAVDDEERIIRGHLTWDGTALTISTNADERADRMLDRLFEACDVQVVSEQRTPITSPQEAAGAMAHLAPPGGLTADDSPVPEEVIEGIRDHLERRWCEESVPALGGLTPRQAAADPTRREQLDRLLHSFEGDGAPDDGITMRPQRLRTLLGM